MGEIRRIRRAPPSKKRLIGEIFWEDLKHAELGFVRKLYGRGDGLPSLWRVRSNSRFDGSLTGSEEFDWPAGGVVRVPMQRPSCRDRQESPWNRVSLPGAGSGHRLQELIKETSDPEGSDAYVERGWGLFQVHSSGPGSSRGNAACTMDVLKAGDHVTKNGQKGTVTEVSADAAMNEIVRVLWNTYVHQGVTTMEYSRELKKREAKKS